MANKDISKEGFWVQKEGKVYKVGLSLVALRELGEITFVDLPILGEINEGDPLLHVESSKATYEIGSPLTGRITKVNEEVLGTISEHGSDDLSTNWIAVYESVVDKAVLV